MLVEVQDEEELIRNHHRLHRKILKPPPPLLWLPPPYPDSIRRCFRNLRQMVDEEERIHIHHLRRRKEFVVEVLYEEEEPIHSRRQIEEVSATAVRLMSFRWCWASSVASGGRRLRWR